MREAPRGKPRGIFARLGGASGEAWAEPCEAKNAIPPCGSLLRHSSSGYEGREPQGFAYSAEAKLLAAKAGLAKKGKLSRMFLRLMDSCVFV